MIVWYRWSIFAVLLFLAGVAQQSLAYRIAIFHTAPDFFLVLLSVGSILCSQTESIVLGFLAGFLLGSLEGANLGHLVATRTLTGFGLSFVPIPEFRSGLLFAGLAAIGATLVAQLLLLLLAPPTGIAGFLADTIRMAMYNGVLAIPVYALLSRILPQTKR